MAKRSKGSIVVSRGAPLPPYIKDQGEEAAGQERARQGGVLLLLGGGLPLLGAAQTAGQPPPLLLYIQGQGGTSRHNN